MIYCENLLLAIAIPMIFLLFVVRKGVKCAIAGILLGMTSSLLGAYIGNWIALVYEAEALEYTLYIAPIIEEIMKLVPIGLFAVLVRPNSETILAFASCVGAGVATFENCCFILDEGAEMLSYTLVRGAAVGIMHVLCAMMAGIGLIIIKRFRQAILPCIIGALTLSCTIHGLYNLLVSQPGVTTYIGYCLPLTIAISLMFPYKRNLGRILKLGNSDGEAQEYGNIYLDSRYIK